MTTDSTDSHLFALFERDKRLNAEFGPLNAAADSARLADNPSEDLEAKEDAKLAEIEAAIVAIRETPAQTLKGVLAKLDWAGPEGKTTPDDDATIDSAREDLRRIIGTATG